MAFLPDPVAGIMEKPHARPTMTVRIAFLLFPDVTQLDLTGPYEVLSRLPGAEVHLAWKRMEPVRSEKGLTILPTTTLSDCPPLDVICVPGGPGVGPLLEDDAVLDWLRERAAQVRYLTSVCTGSLVLGAAGLLQGRRAACHWLSRPLLAELGAEPVAERVVRDGNLFTGGGVTAGIDFALTIAAEIAGPQAAQALQLVLEYDPHPPFDAGAPERAPADVRAGVEALTAGRQRERAELVRRAAARLADRRKAGFPGSVVP
jgi:cyclohexyl-isocyanide hydratase